MEGDPIFKAFASYDIDRIERLFKSYKFRESKYYMVTKWRGAIEEWRDSIDIVDLLYDMISIKYNKEDKELVYQFNKMIDWALDCFAIEDKKDITILLCAACENEHSIVDCNLLRARYNPPCLKSIEPDSQRFLLGHSLKALRWMIEKRDISPTDIWFSVYVEILPSISESCTLNVVKYLIEHVDKNFDEYEFNKAAASAAVHCAVEPGVAEWLTKRFGLSA